MTHGWLDAMASASWQGLLLVALVWVVLIIWKRPSAAVRTWMWLLASAKFLLVAAFVIEVPLLAASAGAPLAGSGTGAETLVLFSDGPRAAPAVDWAQALYVLWSLGVALIAAKAVVDHRTLARFVRLSSPAPDSVHRSFEQVSSGRHARTRLVVSDYAPVPFVFGLLRPVVVLPSCLLHSLDVAELRMVLSHEAAHIARRDALASLYIFVCHAAFFFHPAVWLVRHEWRTEREAACDQWAIDATGAAPQDYAAMLIKVSSGAERAPAFALSAVHTYRTLQRRISIMNKTNKKKSGRALVAAIAALLSIAALPFALVQRKTVPPNGVTGTIGPQVKVTQRRVDAGGPVATGAIAPTVVGGQAMAGPVVEGVPVAAGGIAATRIGGQATAGRSGPGAPVAVRATTVNGQAATGISAPQAANVSGVGTAQAARVTSVNGHVASGGTATAGPAQNETGVIAVPTGAPTNYSGEIAVATGPTQATSVTIVIKDRLSGQGTGLDHRVTLEMKEVEINAFIRSLAQASGVKIATKGVRSSMRLNVQIENATLGDVLGTVAKVYGLEWRVNDDGSITVQPFRPGTAR